MLYTQPQGNASVDSGHPLGARLRFAAFGTSTLPSDAVSRKLPTCAATPVVSSSAMGKLVNTTSNITWLGRQPDLDTGKSVTVFWKGFHQAGGANAGTLLNYKGSVYGWEFGTSNWSPTDIQLVWKATWGGGTNTRQVAVPAGIHSFAAVIDYEANVGQFYIDGVATGSTFTPVKDPNPNDGTTSFNGGASNNAAAMGAVYAFAGKMTAAEIKALHENSFSVLIDEDEETEALFFAAGAGGDQTLSAPLFTNSSSLYAASLAAGPVTLSPSVVANSASFYTASLVRGAVTLVPSLLTNAQTFYSPTVTAGPVTLSPPLVTNSASFFTAALSQAGGAQTLTPTLVTNATSFYAAALAAGPVTLAASLVSNTSTFYAAIISQVGGSQTLAPALFLNANTFYAPSVSAGAVTLQPALFTNNGTFYTALVTRGPVSLLPARVDNSSSFFAATITQFDGEVVFYERAPLGGVWANRTLPATRPANAAGARPANISTTRRPAN